MDFCFRWLRGKGKVLYIQMASKMMGRSYATTLTMVLYSVLAIVWRVTVNRKNASPNVLNMKSIVCTERRDYMW